MEYNIDELLFDLHIPPSVSTDVASVYRDEDANSSTTSHHFADKSTSVLLATKRRLLPGIHGEKGAAQINTLRQSTSIAKKMQRVKGGTTRLPLLEKQGTRNLETKAPTARKDNLPARKRIINEHGKSERAPKFSPGKDSSTYDALLAHLGKAGIPNIAHGSGLNVSKDIGDWSCVPNWKKEEYLSQRRKESSQLPSPFVTSAEREELVKLSNWLDSSIKSTRGDKDELNSILNYMGLAFFEISSQVYSNCQERGLLLVRLWRELINLFELLAARSAQEVSNSKAEQEIEKCKIRTLEDQITMLSSLAGLWKQRAIDAGKVIHGRESANNIKFDWIASASLDLLEQEKIPIEFQPEHSLEQEVKDQPEEEVAKLREKILLLEKELTEAHLERKQYKHLADEEEALRIHKEQIFEADMSTMRLQNEKLSSEIENLVNPKKANDDINNIKECLNSKVQKVEASTQASVPKRWRTLEKTKSFGIPLGPLNSPQANPLRRSGSIFASPRNDLTFNVKSIKFYEPDETERDQKDNDNEAHDHPESIHETEVDDSNNYQEEFIPLDFQQFIPVIPDEFKKDLSMEECNGLLTSICEEKIKVNREVMMNGSVSSPLPQFMYEWALKKYGLRTVAVRELCSILWCIRQYASQSAKATNFAAFLNFSRKANQTTKDGEILLKRYLYIFEKAMHIGPSSLVTEKDTGELFFNLTYAEDITDDELLRNQYGKVHIIGIIRNLKTNPVSVTVAENCKDDNTDKLIWTNFDSMVRNLIEAEETEHYTSEIEALFWAGDANLNGVLEFDEFKDIIQIADPQKGDSEILYMFSQIVMMSSSDDDRLSPYAFSEVVRQHNVKPSYLAVFKLLQNNWPETKTYILHRLDNVEQIWKSKYMQQERIKFVRDQVILLDHSLTKWESTIYKSAAKVLHSKGLDSNSKDEDTQKMFTRLREEHLNTFATKVVEDFKSVIRIYKQLEEVDAT